MSHKFDANTNVSDQGIIDSIESVNPCFGQGIIDMNRNGNFCKGTWVIKVIAEVKVDARFEQKKNWPVFLVSVTELQHLGVVYFIC